MPADATTGLLVCVAGMTICGGLAAYLTWRMVAHTGALRRLRELALREEGSAVVEFPFALLLLVVMTLGCWQFGFIASAYQVADYAAFCAVRSAAVVVPQDREIYPAYTVTYAARTRFWAWREGPNFVFDPRGWNVPSHGALRGKASPKGEDIEGAAALACLGIAGTYTSAGAVRQRAGAGQLPDFLGVSGSGPSTGSPGLVGRVLQTVASRAVRHAGGYEPRGVLGRLVYALEHTHVTLSDPPAGPTVAGWQTVEHRQRWSFGAWSFGWSSYTYLPHNENRYPGGTLLTCRVRHDFQLKLPYVRRLFSTMGGGKEDASGYYLTVTGSASMLCEGYDEARPPQAPAATLDGEIPPRWPLNDRSLEMRFDVPGERDWQWKNARLIAEEAEDD